MNSFLPKLAKGLYWKTVCAEIPRASG